MARTAVGHTNVSTVLGYSWLNFPCVCKSLPHAYSLEALGILGTLSNMVN